MSTETRSAAVRAQTAHRLESAAGMLLTRGTMSRTELAEATGYSASAMTSTIRELIDLGHVREIGLGRSTGGRRRTLLQFDRRSVLLTLVALDSGHLVVRQVDLEGTVQNQVRRPLDRRDPLRSVLAAIDAIGAIAVEPSHCIVIALPGVVSAEGAVHLAPALGDELPASVRDAIADATGCPVIAENDVNLLALGEADCPNDDFVLIYVGEGIGAALVLDGIVRRGAAFSAGEIGFLPWGRERHAGGVGGLESRFSTTALVRAAAELGIEAGERGIIPALEASPFPEAAALLRGALEAWAYAAVVSICVVDPGHVVLAGDAVRLSAARRDELVELIATNAPGSVQVEFARNGDGAIVRGAIAHLQHAPSIFLTAGPEHKPDLDPVPEADAS